MINRESGPVVLFNENDWSRFRESLVSGNSQGWYGSYPDENGRNRMKNQLYFLADKAGESLFHEKDFILRYLASLAVFLTAFFLLSYVLKDPVPLIDEIVLSLVGSVSFNFWWKQRRSHSLGCDKIKLDIRNEIDSIAFEESEILGKLELYLQNLDHQDLTQVQEIAPPLFWDKQERLCRSFFSALQGFWTNRELNKEMRLYKKGNLKKEDFRDLPLFLLWLKLR